MGQGCKAGLNSMREEGKLQFLNLDGPMPFSNTSFLESFFFELSWDVGQAEGVQQVLTPSLWLPR